MGSFHRHSLKAIEAMGSDRYKVWNGQQNPTLSIKIECAIA